MTAQVCGKQVLAPDPFESFGRQLEAEKCQTQRLIGSANQNRPIEKSIANESW